MVRWEMTFVHHHTQVAVYQHTDLECVELRSPTNDVGIESAARAFFIVRDGFVVVEEPGKRTHT